MASTTQPDIVPGGDTFVARLPILDAARRVVGYELVFRPIRPDRRTGTADVASARVIGEAVLDVGLQALTNGHKAFVPVSRHLLLEGVPAVLPPAQAVLLLATDIEADGEVLDACRRFRRDGYQLAVDGFVLNAWTEDLVPLVQFLKVDVGRLDAEARAAVVARCGAGGPTLIAAGVESQAVFEQARAEAFTLFQGFFFGRPTLQAARGVPAQQMGNLRLLQALNQPDVSVTDLEELIKRDAALAYRVLRTVNSAAFAQRRSIESIRQALIMLGRDTVRRWASLWALSGLGGGGSSELVVMSTVRARCCELLAQATADAGPQGFLVGMCSLLDALLDCPLEEAIAGLPLAADVQAALIGEENGLRRVLHAAVACEAGDWEAALAAAEQVSVTPADLRRAYADALKWAHELHQVATAAA